MTTLFDSSIIIALFRINETHHKQAVKIFMQESNIIILDFVLSEVLTVLKMREGHNVAKKCYKYLTNHQKIHILKTSRAQFQTALEYFYKNENRLSIVDTLLYVISRTSTSFSNRTDSDMKLVTFDKDLFKLI